MFIFMCMILNAHCAQYSTFARNFFASQCSHSQNMRALPDDNQMNWTSCRHKRDILSVDYAGSFVALLLTRCKCCVYTCNQFLWFALYSYCTRSNLLFQTCLQLSDEIYKMKTRHCNNETWQKVHAIMHELQREKLRKNDKKHEILEIWNENQN